MNQQLRCFFWLFVVFSLLSCGCASREEIMRDRLASTTDIPLRALLQRGIQASGGIDRWARIEQIEGDSLVELMGLDDKLTIIEQAHKIRWDGTIHVSKRSKQPNGTWLKEMQASGEMKVFIRNGDTTRAVDIHSDGAALALRVLYHSLTGLPGLLDEGVELTYGLQERQGGHISEKIIARGKLFGGSDGDELVIWLDAETYLPERLWLRTSKGNLAVRMSNYDATESGLILPRRVELLIKDSYRIFGSKARQAINYQHMRVVLLED